MAEDDKIIQTEVWTEETTETTPKPRSRGFADPETRKKAMAKSLATRARNRESKFTKLMDREETGAESNVNLPVTVSETDVEVFKGGIEGFTPSLHQLKILAVALSLDHGDTIREWFRAAGVNRNVWYTWIRDPDFIAWWNKSFTRGIEQYRSEWVSIGIKRMNSPDPDRFAYWKEVGAKVFGFIQELKLKTDKSPEEEALTKELLLLVSDVNKERGTKLIDGTVTTVDVVELSKEVEQGSSEVEIDSHYKNDHLEKQP